MNALLKNRVFLLVIASDILQQFAIWIRNMALLFFVMEQTNNDPVAVSILSVMEYAPIFIFSFVGGALADRWNPNRTMITGDILSALSIVMIVFLLNIGYWQALFAATFVSAVVSQFSQPATSRVFKHHVEEEHVSAAIAISQSLQALFLIFGPVVGTFVYTQLGLFASLYSLIIIFVLSALCLSFLPGWMKEVEARQSSLWNDIKEGWLYVLRSNPLRMLAIAFSIIGLAAGLVQPLEVFLVVERLGMEKEAVQYLTAADGIGMLIGGGVAAVVSKKVKQKHLLVFGMIILAVSFVVEGFSTSFWITVCMRFITGICLACVNIVIGTFMIQLVDENMIGRVNGTVLPLFMSTLLIGVSLGGVLKETTSLVIVFSIAAVLGLAAILPVLRMKMTQKQGGVC
ncbi:MFS transporter [Bacillus sp. WLY-B-L8]|uniref:MFS transporter n=1 Tax=Bacillus multifaciens TaxID=3068506 RepID=UPI002791391D|nr:MFS transporter [Bacillus sp. WLY-B-L8]